MSAVDPVVTRLKALLRHDAPPIPRDQFMNPDFTKGMADMVGLDETSQRLIKASGGSGALGLFMYEAVCKAQAELAEDMGGTEMDAKAAAAKKAKESKAKAVVDESLLQWHVEAALHNDTAYKTACEKMSEDLTIVDKMLSSLLKKHAQSDPKWAPIVRELEQATGVKKSEKWCKKRAKQFMLTHAKASVEAGQTSGGTGAQGKDEAARIDATLDQLAGELAFEETMKLVNERIPGLIPNACSMEMGVESEAVLWMLRSTEDFKEQSQFFRGVAIKTIHTEGVAASALLEVYSYLESHPESRQALRELKALVCLLVGLQLSGNVNVISELAATRRAAELFAWGSLVSDLALSLFTKKQEQGKTAPPSVFAVFEGMQRCSSKVLQHNEQDFPSLLVQSRLQGDNDHAKLKLQKDCIAALELGKNAEWVVWKARVYEMIGLTYGGMGNFKDAAHSYKLALMSSKSRNTLYLRAQGLDSMGEYQDASELLDEYFTAVADDAAYDDYLFPNALYLKGIICMALKDLNRMRSFHRQAMAAEGSSRCLFYGPVSSSAKRSLDRVCRVTFGNDKERQAALMEFAAVFQSKSSTKGDGSAAGRAVNLSDVDPEDLISETPDRSTSSESSQLRVHIVTLSRHPASLRDALLHGDDLAECCTALQEQGMNPELPNGAKVFSHPDDFKLVLSALGGQTLMPFHVVVTSEFLDALHSAVASLKSKDQVRQKSDLRVGVSMRVCWTCNQHDPKYRCQCKVAYYCSQQCQKMDYGEHVKTCRLQSESPFIVSKTFLDIKLPMVRSAGRSAATKSTTDADARKGKNPRGSSILPE